MSGRNFRGHFELMDAFVFRETAGVSSPAAQPPHRGECGNDVDFSASPPPNVAVAVLTFFPLMM